MTHPIVCDAETGEAFVVSAVHAHIDRPVPVDFTDHGIVAAPRPPMVGGTVVIRSGDLTAHGDFEIIMPIEPRPLVDWRIPERVYVRNLRYVAHRRRG